MTSPKVDNRKRLWTLHYTSIVKFSDQLMSIGQLYRANPTSSMPYGVRFELI